MTEITREYLSTLTLKQIQLLDIRDREEEELVQEFVSKLKGELAPEIAFNRILVPDLKTPEEEAEWQKKIDEYQAEHNVVLIQNADVELADVEDVEEVEEEEESDELTDAIEEDGEATIEELTKELEEVKAEIVEAQAEIKAEDIVPETFKVETVQFVDNSSDKTEDLEKKPKRFCEFCSSKARFHKVGCPLK